jgi:hypothetical protein
MTEYAFDNAWEQARQRFYGRRVYGDLRARGLEEIETEGRVFCWGGGSAGAAAWRLTFEQLGSRWWRRGRSRRRSWRRSFRCSTIRVSRCYRR